MLMLGLIAVLTFMIVRSGFEPLLLAALLVTFMSQMGCFTFVVFSENDRLSTSISNRKHVASVVGGTAICVILALTLMLGKVITMIWR